MSDTDRSPNLVPLGGGLERNRTSSQIVDYVMSLIYSGRLRSDARVDVSVIAAALGVSTMPVREALLELRRAGVVYGKFHRAAYVCRFDEETILDTFDLYGSLWSRCTTTLTKMGDEATLEMLGELAGRMKTFRDPADIERCTAEYRRVISHKSGSDRLRGLIRSFRSFVPHEYRLSVPALSESLRERIVEEYEAIKSGDAEVAGSVTRQLYDHQGEIVVADLRARGVID
jgi:DNA-binding GntR family transcriptional regulator